MLWNVKNPENESKLTRDDMLLLIAVHRLNTYVFIHNGLFHMAMNVLALTPLLERFESEHGTLTTLLTFLGREFYITSPCRIVLDSWRLTLCSLSPSLSVFDDSRWPLSTHRRGDFQGYYWRRWRKVSFSPIAKGHRVNY